MFFVAFYGDYGLEHGYFSRVGAHKEAMAYLQNRSLKTDTVIAVGAEAARQFWSAMKGGVCVEEATAGGTLTHNAPNSSKRTIVT